MTTAATWSATPSARRNRPHSFSRRSDRGSPTTGLPRRSSPSNGAQYISWRGKSAFSKECEKRGVRQIVAHPRRPQTLGKIEQFWGSLWRELLESAVFLDLADARRRIDLYVSHYNFHRPHQGIDGLVPADRYFHAAPQVRRALEERIEANALDLARSGDPKKPFYLTGQVGGRAFSVHAEGERLYLRKDGADREEIDLLGAEEETVKDGETEDDRPAPPGTSALDAWLERLSGPEFDAESSTPHDGEEE